MLLYGRLNIDEVYPANNVKFEIMINVIRLMIFATGLGQGSQDKMLERSATVNRVPTFSDMNEQYVNLVKHLFQRYSCRSGTIVIQQGQPA